MKGTRKWLGISAIAVIALVLGLSGSVAASGTGYNLSFSQAEIGSFPDVALTALSTSNPSSSALGGSANVTVSFTVAGQFQSYSSQDDYLYWIYFGGDTDTNATAWVGFDNNNTSASWYSGSSGGYAYGTLLYTISGGGSTVTFSIATSVVGPSSSFSATAYAVYGSGTSGGYTWLGSDQSSVPGGGNGGGGSCTSTGCTASTAAGFVLGGLLLAALIGVIVVVVIIVVVVVLVMRGRKASAQAPPPNPPGWMPPSPPGMAPPPPPPSPPMPPPPPPSA
jgi:hypothetical protein